jgi:hypothetical protein
MSVPGGEIPGYPSYNRRPLIRFDAISEALRFLQTDMGTWIVATLIYLLIEGAITGVFMGSMFVEMFAGIGSGKPPKNVQPSFLSTTVFTLVIAAVSAFLSGGLYRMATKQLRGEPINPGMLFGAGDVYPALLGFTLILSIAGMLFNLLPGGVFISLPFTVIIGGLLMFTVPLIADKRMRLGEALGASWGALSSQGLMAILFYFVTSVIAGLGFIACCVGLLFTVPLQILSVSCLYRDFFMEPVGPTGPYTPPPSGFTPPSDQGAPPPPPPPPPPAPEPPVAEAPPAPSTEEPGEEKT